MKFAPTITHHDYQTAALNKEMAKYVEDVFETPIVSLTAPEPMPPEDSPAADIILWALLYGGLKWDGRYFTGRFSAKVSRALRLLGAKPTADGFELEKPPMALHSVRARAKAKTDEALGALAVFLTAVEAHLDEAHTGIPSAQVYRDLMKELDSQWGEDAQPPPITEIEEYQASVNLTAKEIVRAEVQKAVEQVAKLRQEQATLHEIVEHLHVNTQHAKRRTRMVADNLTAEAVAGYRKRQAIAIRSPGYVWCTRCDSLVRSDHAHLEGRFFSWDEPPVTNTATGSRNHPGEDYNCRCTPKIVRVK